MTITELNEIRNQFTNAIKEYSKSQEFDSKKLELCLDDFLIHLPQDQIYLEWYNRSQIQEIAVAYADNNSVSEDKIDECMYGLWDTNDSYMSHEEITYTIEDTMAQ